MMDRLLQEHPNMKPVDVRTLDIMRISALALGVVLAIFAVIQYYQAGVRPDAAEMRDLLLIAALEIAFVPLAISFLLPQREDDTLLPPTGLKRGTSVPNPWAY